MDEMIEERCGLPESAPCRAHDDHAAAVVVVRDLRRVCRAWRDAIGYTTSAIEMLEFDFDQTRLAPSEIDWPAFANLKELSLHGETCRGAQPTRLPDGLRSLRALQKLDVPSFHVAEIPSWFAELQLQELRLDFWGPFDRTGLRSRVFKSCTRECLRKDGWLPPSVRRLTVHESAAIVAPERFAQQLESLVMNEYYMHRRQPTWEYPSYAWLSGSRLRHLRIIEAQIEPMVAALEAAPLLESLSLSTEGRRRCGDKAALERFLRHDAARPLPRLRELSTKGFAFDLNSLRGLQLRKLSLNELYVDEWTKDLWISALPEWIAEMPLTELAILHAHQLRRLPSSLAGLKSLRFLDLHGSGIASLFDRQAIHDGEIDAPTLSEAGATTNDITRLLLANGTLAIRLFTFSMSRMAYHYEVKRMPLRG
jgi:Leucine-rich repeat (LRR) protein